MNRYYIHIFLKSLVRLSNRTKMTKGRITELENRSMEHIQSYEETEKSF